MFWIFVWRKKKDFFLIALLAFAVCPTVALHQDLKVGVASRSISAVSSSSSSSSSFSLSSEEKSSSSEDDGDFSSSFFTLTLFLGDFLAIPENDDFLERVSLGDFLIPEDDDDEEEDEDDDDDEEDDEDDDDNEESKLIPWNQSPLTASLTTA